MATKVRTASRVLDATGGWRYVLAMKIEPKAMAIPKSTDHLEKGKYGPIFPKTPACYGFTIVANVKPGRADAMRAYGEAAGEGARGRSRTSSRRSSSTTCAGSSSTTTRGSCTRASSTPTSTSTPKTPSCCSERRASTPRSRTSRVFRMDWKTNPQAFVKFVRDHQCNSFLEYGGVPVLHERRDQEGPEDQGGARRDARADAVGAVMGEATTARTYNQDHAPRKYSRAAGG